jgi:Peptidase A4 family
MRLAALISTIAAVTVGGTLTASAAASSTLVSSPEVSSNWSGYAVTALSDTVPVTFSDVTGTWVEPRATCAGASTTSAAFWVGLGGNDPASAGLEQLGTSVDCNATGKATYSAWWEIVPAAAVPLKLKIAPGDTITAAVVVNGQRTVMSLKDVTRGTRFTKTITTAQTLDVTSAEWIAEAPSACTSSGRCRVVPLTNFGKVTFSKAAAIGNGHPGTISDPLWNATPIELRSDSSFAFGRFAGTPTTSFDAIPTDLTADGRGFSVAAQTSA